MYTAYIGQRVLDVYNAHRHTGPPLTPRQFYDEVFFRIIFDDTRYLMLANNSKFDQAAKQKKKRPLTSGVRQEALEAFHADTVMLTEPHGHLFLGGTARTVDAATSSQVTDLPIPVDADQVYLSWIGAATGIGIKGGLTLLIDHEDVLRMLVDGWQAYRKYMTQTVTLKPYQIETWNGWWLQIATHDEFDSNQPFALLGEVAPDEPKKNSRGQHAFSTPPWIKVLFALKRIDAASVQMAYVYSFGQTNTTIGFIRLDLPAVHSLTHLFGKHHPDDQENMVRLYETEFGFKTACEQGVIGLRAIEPKKLRQYMPTHRDIGKLPKLPKKKTDEITLNIYRTWIIAMLNNEDLLRLTYQTAEALNAVSQKSKRLKTTHTRLVKQVLESNSKTVFIEHLKAVLDEDCSHKDLFCNVVEQVVKMPSSNMPLFIALLRFQYTAVSC